MHGESLNCLVVLNHRIKTLLLQFLPILAQLVLVVVVEHQQKVLNVRNGLFQLEITFSCKKVVRKLLQFSYTVLSVLQREGQRLMIWNCEV